ncbi:MAG: hypothetical protein K9H49_11490 [Bacteroidales bacterium]|nr:hypothetical protein [Bacteroidales bacterium]MCF8390860.1 hypothetical protein [Bacteroidales bacterium]
MIEIKSMVQPYKVEEVRNLTNAAYILRFRKNEIRFKPGQHLVVGLENTKGAREYSIYSGVEEPYLEILVREVEEGDVSKKLHNLFKDDRLKINGPYGFFMYNAKPLETKKFLFIATGTGIAPFHSFVRTYPEANYKVIHGIRKCDEAYERSHYKEGSYVACTSKDEKGDFHGRLTDYLKQTDLDKDLNIYLCGNSEMIVESMRILEQKGFDKSQMFTEVYF